VRGIGRGTVRRHGRRVVGGGVAVAEGEGCICKAQCSERIRVTSHLLQFHQLRAKALLSLVDFQFRIIITIDTFKWV